ncbi:hypothetical protein [Streptomyces sp. CNQ085]|uniref:hypothetical protein n=1 Tax=Streptomyces sp. CNQ085 TaxID=2886944 RepID=UPI001F50F8FA|nr:hypothetical protein [Streptomyces sp. CNQ085]MCI0385068.1 hypothetical protein [Streptomyces sp. CNQ085]
MKSPVKGGQLGGPRRVKVTSPQTRIALARGHRRHPQLLPLPAPADAEAARAVFAGQRRTALRTVVLLGVVLFGSSGTIAALPVLDRLSVAGVPVSWLVLVAATYPVLLLALCHVRRAERAENSAGTGAGSGP